MCRFCAPFILCTCLWRALLHVVVFLLCLCLCCQSWRRAAFESTFTPVIGGDELDDATHLSPYSIHCTPYPVSSFMPSIHSCAERLHSLSSGTVVCRPAFASLDSWIDVYPIFVTVMECIGGMHCGVLSEERFENGAPIDESRVIHYSRDGNAARLPPIISWSGWTQLLFQNKSVVNYEPLRVFGRHLLIQLPHPRNMPHSWNPELLGSAKDQIGQFQAWHTDTAIPLARSAQSYVDGSLEPCRQEARELQKMFDSTTDKPRLHPYLHALTVPSLTPLRTPSRPSPATARRYIPHSSK